MRVMEREEVERLSNTACLGLIGHDQALETFLGRVHEDKPETSLVNAEYIAGWVEFGFTAISRLALNLAVSLTLGVLQAATTVTPVNVFADIPPADTVFALTAGYTPQRRTQVGFQREQPQPPAP